ncbi:MAG: hypothetical protein L3K03_05850 [Thermoplasmata archaeon]|nr:hypothetical protein [Thermoplasmata archaeon]
MASGTASELHSHKAEEVVNYVLSGSLTCTNEEGHSENLTEGWVNMFSTVRERRHDVAAMPGSPARWLAVLLHIPRTLPDPESPSYSYPAIPRALSTPGVRCKRVVSSEGPRGSLRELELLDFTFPGAVSMDVHVGLGRRTVAYLLDGGLRLDGQDMAAGDGLLMDDVPQITLSTQPGSRMILASVPSEGFSI